MLPIVLLVLRIFRETKALRGFLCLEKAGFAPGPVFPFYLAGLLLLLP